MDRGTTPNTGKFHTRYQGDPLMIHLLQRLPACYGVMVGQRKLLDLPTFRPFDELTCTESAVGCQGMCVEVNDQGLYTLHWIY